MKALLTSPISYLFLFVALIFFLNIFKRFKRHYILVLIPAAMLIYFLIIPYGSNYILLKLSVNDVNIDCNSKQAVLLAGGLVGRPLNVTDYKKMTRDSFMRAQGAIEWLSKYNGKLIVSGAGARSKNGEAEIIFNYINQFTQNQFEIEFDDTSQTTHISAINLKKRLKTKHIVLITSQLHIKRAQLTFQQEGYTVCPYISHYQYVNNTDLSSFIPNGHAIVKSEAVLHELFGILWYWWTDRISLRS